MVKKQTGRKLTPQEFRKLNNCVFCGKAETIPHGGRCEECAKIDFKHCEICELVLRTEPYTSYVYDIREDHREIEFKVNKEYVIEFVYSENPYYKKHSDTLCEGCVDWEKTMKDICWSCDNDFYNNKEHYKINGNLCEVCVASSEEKENG